MKQLADTFESIVIGTALEYTHGRRVDAATRLGIGRKYNYTQKSPSSNLKAKTDELDNICFYEDC